jgi:PAS domain S-box-containing protein
MISPNAALPGFYDYGEVSRSLLIAIAASYAALDLAGRITAASGRIRLAWLSGGAFAMGIGIWAMHFKGMLAFHLPVPVKYHWPTVLASLLVAILASAVALYVASRPKMGPVEALTGSIFMGAGIAGVHYIGKDAMRLPAFTQYSTFLVVCSILLAILFSLLALLMAFGLRAEPGWTVPRRLGSATLMGAAISAMHYTGMASASFIPASPPDLSHAVSVPPLGNYGVFIATLIVLVAAMVTSSVDRRASAEIQRLNRDLEDRVVERTFQLEAVNQSLRKEVAERERAEESVRASEDRLRLVIDTIPQRIWSGAPDGSLDYFNAQWRAYTGLTQEELQGEGWRRMLHPDDREPAQKVWRESVASGTPFEQEVRHRRADGQYRWFLVRGVPLRESGGRIVRWYGTSTDIEDRKRAEDAVRRSEEHLRLVIDTVPAMLHSARPDGYVDFFNKRWLEYVGVSLEDIRGWGWTNVLHPDDVEGVVGQWRSSVATGKPFEAEARLRRADGEYRLMLLRKVPLHNETGSIVKWYGSSTDFEDRKRAQEELKRSEEKYRVIVEAASDAVISMAESGGILLANPATARIFGYDPVELIGKPLTALMPEFMRKLHEAGFRRYLATGERHLNWHGAELTALRKNGQEFPVEVSFGEMTSNGHKVFTGFIRDISEKKRAEDELRRQKEVFQKIFESIPEMIVFLDPDRSHELVNPEWERKIGWTVKELRERNLDVFAEAFPDPQYRQMVMDDIAASTGQWTDLKVRVRDGHVIDVTASFVHLSNGSTLFIGRDTTERKQAEEALRTSEREQHKIAEQLETERARLLEAQAVAKMGSWETELPSLDVTWSEQTYRIFETDPSHFHPTRPGFVKLVHPEDRAKVDAAFEASLEKGVASRVEYRIVMADGRVKVLEEHWEVFHDEQGRPARLIGTCQDITERKRMEEALRESEARFRLVADSAPVMIWMSGTDKLCTYFNKPWLDFTGRSIDHELGNGWAEGVHHEDLQRCMTTYIQAFDHREAFAMEYRLRRHDGEFRWVLDLGVPRFNPDGFFAGYIGSCIDVTEQRRAEEQLRQAHTDLARVTRVAAMGELAAAIAHEVNQPLTAIITNGNFSLRQLERAIPDPDELRAAITEIVSDGTRASAVISRIRGLLMKGTVRRAHLDINEIVHDVTALLHNELIRNRISLRTDLVADLPRVDGDPVQLQQVLINLVMNAIEAMRTYTDGKREIVVRSAKNPDTVLVQVQDSGPGMEPGVADRIFEPFFTTKAEGIGMGLSISRSIIESHGGRLWAVAEPQGALFEFTVPTQE